MKIYLGADHGGFAIKESLLVWLHSPEAAQISQSPLHIEDLGAYELDATDDYPMFGLAVGKAIAQFAQTEDVRKNPVTYGVLLCRTGGGIAIAANRFLGVRAVVCRTEEDVVHAREHNNANVLVLEGDHVLASQAQDFVQLFLQTPFGGGRHERRVQQLDRAWPLGL